MKNTYLIFLDFDGVLIYEKEMIENNNHGFAPFSVNLLKNLIEDEERLVNYKIVISSSLRIGRTLKELKEMFEPFGLQDYIVGKTPDLGFRIKRGFEIEAYLNETDIEYRDFVILDDEDDMHNYINRLIQTNAQNGLDEFDIDELKDKVRRIERMHNTNNFSGGYGKTIS